MNHPKGPIETIRENLSTKQVLASRDRAISQGKRVNVMRLHSRLVQIEIITPDRAIEVTPPRRMLTAQ